jgi:hypothetical protein
VDRSIQTITRWNALSQDWQVVAPPISGYKDDGGMFPIDAFSGSNMWTAKFDQNTTKISQGQAQAKGKQGVAETKMTAREAIIMLGKISPNKLVKITIVS